jgi:hypothetical protein
MTTLAQATSLPLGLRAGESAFWHHPVHAMTKRAQG